LREPSCATSSRPMGPVDRPHRTVSFPIYCQILFQFAPKGLFRCGSRPVMPSGPLCHGALAGTIHRRGASTRALLLLNARGPAVPHPMARRPKGAIH
jgi:hypothetical protein